MSLLGFQTALGRLIRAPLPDDSAEEQQDPLHGIHLTADERVQITRLANSRGFRFTRGIQRSWSEGRAAKSAALTLSILPLEQRRRLVHDWVSAGRATNSFFTSEAEAFLAFIARHLPDPSHAMTVCCMERAVYRVSATMESFRLPDVSMLNDPDVVLFRGSCAAFVHFFTEPERLVAALNGNESLPPLAEQSFPVLFAPGLTALFRSANREEVALWARLSTPVMMRVLSQEGHTMQTIEGLVTVGGADIAQA